MHAVQVANKRTGADADRFDYLKRDSMMCGVVVPLDAKRLMLFSRLSPDRTQVCGAPAGWGGLCSRGALKLWALQQPPSRQGMFPETALPKPPLSPARRPENLLLKPFQSSDGGCAVCVHKACGWPWCVPSLHGTRVMPCCAVPCDEFCDRPC